MLKPYVICHMMSSLDGKTDSKALAIVAGENVYETTGDLLDGDAWLCGRVTMQKDFSEYAEAAPFDNDGSDPVGGSTIHVARKSETYAIVADTRGQIAWKGPEIDGDHIIAIVSEKASQRYLDELRRRQVSYIVAGQAEIDFQAAFRTLAVKFGIKRLLLEGGGRVNAAVADAGLVDELSLLLLPGIDGRSEPHASFDGRRGTAQDFLKARLTSIERRNGDVLWLRYQLEH